MSAQNDPVVHRMYDWIESHKQEMVESLRGVLRIPSVEAQPEAGAPFGRPVRDALDYTLELCKKMGFDTFDCDGYAGHAEFGSGTEYIGVLGHLDVVPEGDRWNVPPYGAELKDGYIYARGASDDKGPTYAALFAAKALMESGALLNKRIRIIFGCNEESGFGCVHHYFETAGMERPAAGFTPDACFPLIYAEKGIANIVLQYARAASSTLRVDHAQGGRRPNMVPDFAEAVLKGSQTELEAAENALKKFWDRNVQVERLQGELHVAAIGKSAHGSTPVNGDNAIARLAKALLEAGLAQTEPWLHQIVETVDFTGGALGIAHTDDVAGPLTCNLGMIECNEQTVSVTYNVRYPVTWNADEMKAALLQKLQGSEWKLADLHDSPPLYVPLDQEPVATLLAAYREETGDTQTQPATTGGGTYARATPNTVAFGAAFPQGSDGPAHEPDERIAVETLVRAARIYANALYQLAGR